jgi:hydrogenase expression/formation protein HypE
VSSGLSDAEARVEARIEKRRRSQPRFVDERVTMAHGAGGKASRALVEGLFVPAFDNAELAALGDAAVIGGRDLAITTDGFVVTPIRFPGGSIGELAVNGTVNDLAVSGARPLLLTAAFVLEEGLEATVLRAEVEAMAAAAGRAGVTIVAGDTKVVERGKADQMFVTTTGVGVIDARASLDPASVRPGDAVLVSGSIGDHGVAIMLARDELAIEADVRSDTTSLWPAVDALLEACGGEVRCLRDATRGGVATVLNELALASDVCILLDEAAVPVRPEVAGACELLGIDPLYVANEGKLVAVVAGGAVDRALAALRSTEVGTEAAVVGEVGAEPPGRVLGRTPFGGHRMIDLLVGDPLPRIC